MFFYLSKLIWFVLDPANLLFFTFLIGFVLLLKKRWVLGRAICGLGVMMFLAIAVVPSGHYLLSYLEYRFEKPTQLPENLSGIIVLGGVIDEHRTLQSGALVLGPNRERVDVLKDLSRRYPTAKIVFTSGSGRLVDQSVKEADLIAPYLKEIVDNPARLILERQSRNTYENVLYSKTLLDPKPDETWVMITNASHMPRSVGIFRQQAWDVIPYPVAYRTWPEERPVIEPIFRHGFDKFQAALHEWLGLLMYHLTDKTSELFPRPPQ